MFIRNKPKEPALTPKEKLLHSLESKYWQAYNNSLGESLTRYYANAIDELLKNGTCFGETIPDSFPQLPTGRIPYQDKKHEILSEPTMVCIQYEWDDLVKEVRQELDRLGSDFQRANVISEVKQVLAKYLPKFKQGLEA